VHDVQWSVNQLTIHIRKCS